MSKRILMISSTWDTAYIQRILVGMLQRLKNEDVDLYVFNAYDEALEDEYQMMERAIYSLPDPYDFDGVLLAVNSVGNQSAANMLADHYTSLGKPVLSMELQFEGVPSIGTDNYQAEYELVEHLINVHGCRTFNYVGGPREHMENQERFRAFCDCMKAYDIPIEEERIAFYAFNDEDGRRAFREFARKGLHLPDAVICANDSMALGYCSEASEHGFYAPTDYKIVGFDNSDRGANYYPAITSVERCWEEHGYESIEQLLKLMNGVKLINIHSQSLKLCLNGSCGCRESNRDPHRDINGYYTRQYNQEVANAFNRRSQKKLVGCVNMSDFQKRLEACQKMIGADTLALCLNASLFQEEIKEKMDYDQTFLVYTDGASYVQTAQEGLVPKSWKKDHKIYFFAPLHFERINFGYCVIANIGSWYADVDHRTFMESICLALEAIRQHSILERVNQRLEDLYVRDSMTGMYNRFGYESYAKAYYQKHDGKVQVYYFDLDNLKLYNDCFGHAVGDNAILGVAHGLKREFGEDAIYVRMGGDEFLVICHEESDRDYLTHKTHLMNDLLAYSKEHQLPFSIQVSMGSVSNQKSNQTLEEMIWIADHNMYQDKREKRRKTESNKDVESKLISAEFAQIIENIPDRVIDTDDIMNVFRKYVPEITTQYGILYLGAVQVEPGLHENEPVSRQEIVIFDVRSGKKTNDYSIRFETNRGGYVAVTAGLSEHAEWTEEMKKDIFLLSKTIYLMIGRATAMNALNHMTYTDQMTGIGNSKALMQYMHRVQAEGKLTQYCNNFINICSMKLYNERLGKGGGDQVLIRFARTLDGFVQNHGFAARLGGDNFVVFLEKEYEDAFLAMMDHLSLAVNDQDGQKHQLIVRIRAGYYFLQEGDTPSNAMENSSIAMQYAKNGTQAGSLSYEHYMKENVLRMKMVEESAPVAFRENEFIVYYQPKASIEDINHFTLNGGEALVRWMKDGKLIMPGEFIDVFEQSGLITQLDFYVFEQVCRDLSEWKQKGLPLVRISSNFSRRHLKDQHLAEKVEAILKKYNVDPQYLEIEITESYDLEDMAVLIRFEKRMHELGIHLSVDDFGSGFSSLKMIKNIVSDTIKLDKSIIDGIGDNHGDEIIVQHMVRMILSLGKEVIAEGVENLEQAVFLHENNCTNIQGFLFGRPMEKEKFEILLANL